MGLMRRLALAAAAGALRRGAIGGKTTRYGKRSYTEASNMAMEADGLMASRLFWFTYKFRWVVEREKKKMPRDSREWCTRQLSINFYGG